MIRKSPTLALLFAAAVGALYGILGRVVFGTGALGEVFGVMSLAFVFVLPYAIGYAAIMVAPDWHLQKRAYRIFLPWLSVLLSVFGVWVTGWEGKICVIMLLPLLLAMSSLGGAVATGVRRRPVGRRLYATSLVSVLLLPYVAAPLEQGIAPADRLRVVETQIRIRATPDDVWRQIVRVPRIQPSEYGTSAVHRIGFPRPVEATLSHEGVGGVRRASFERGVVFIETVTTWRPDSLLSFTIHADPSTIPPTALDEHVTIGGEHFDVLDGTYRIERIGADEVILHLSSTHRLSTRFNFYAQFWSDLVMRQIQDNILAVVKNRAEAG